jgi:hypothetical protein
MIPNADEWSIIVPKTPRPGDRSPTTRRKMSLAEHRSADQVGCKNSAAKSPFRHRENPVAFARLKQRRRNPHIPDKRLRLRRARTLHNRAPGSAQGDYGHRCFPPASLILCVMGSPVYEGLLLPSQKLTFEFGEPVHKDIAVLIL